MCAGQSNAMLWVSHTFGRNESALNYSSGAQNIRIMGGGDTNFPYASWPPAYARGYPGADGRQVAATNPWMTAAEAVPAGCIDKQNCPLFGTSGACWYALQNAAEAGVDVPLGLVALTLGGQRIEEFMANVSGSTGPYVCAHLAAQNIPCSFPAPHHPRDSPRATLTPKSKPYTPQTLPNRVERAALRRIHAPVC